MINLSQNRKEDMAAFTHPLRYGHQPTFNKLRKLRSTYKDRNKG